MVLHQASGVSQGSILGLVLLSVFINVLDTDLECIQSKFMDNTKLGRDVDSHEGRKAL